VRSTQHSNFIYLFFDYYKMAHRGGFHGGFRGPEVIVERPRPELIISPGGGYIAPAPYYGPVTYLGPIPSAILTIITLMIIMIILYSLVVGSSSFEPYRGNFTPQQVAYHSPPVKKSKSRYKPHLMQQRFLQNPTIQGLSNPRLPFPQPYGIGHALGAGNYGNSQNKYYQGGLF
jgi:hypothetical protein